MSRNERDPKRQKLSPPSDHAGSPPPPPSTSLPKDTNGRSSWYGRTWPRKAAPVTQVARESIASASSAAVETAAVVRDKVTSSSSRSASTRKSSLALTLGHTTSYKSQPLEAVSTNDHATQQGRRQSGASVQQPAGPEIAQEVVPESGTSAPAQSNASAVEPGSTQEATQDESIAKDTAPRSWIGWLAGGDGMASKQKADAISPDKKEEHAYVPETQEATKYAEQSTTMPDQNVSQAETRTSAETVRRSWLPIWNNNAASQSAPVIAAPKEDAQPQEASVPAKPAESVAPKFVSSEVRPSETEQANLSKPAQPKSTNRNSGWSFWSRETNPETSSTKSAPEEPETVSDGKQSERNASETVKSPEPRKPSSIASADDAVLNAHKKKQKGQKGSKDLRQFALEKDSKTTKVENKAATATAVAPTEANISRSASPVPKKQYDHLLLPSLQETLKFPENPTLYQQLARLFYSPKDSELKHLDLVKDPLKIKNALVIGVHGYFPAPLIQSVLGRPTGTSVKFADMAAKSIKRYTRAHGYECSVKMAALEGEGKIAERIDLLWKLLLNWIDDIRKADFVFIASHSQGVPVAIMLLAKLIHFGCVSGARVGVCAMAGVNMGPFPEYKSRWISGSSAGELFEFADPTSKVSKDYLAALDDVLSFGTRLTYIGSIDDQLVSMESSIFAPVSHPHIFRAVSIDSRLQAPDFVSHLVAFALKLRNLGVQDHGLIRELSAPLAGSLYTGEGHSRLYEDAAIYDLALSFALETTSMPGTPLARRDIDSAGTNPYILPFAMRGILEEDFVKSDLQAEASKLLSQFDDWKPQTKALKDVKFRLEGIRSKL